MTEPLSINTPNAVPFDPKPLSSALPPHSPAALVNGHVTEDGDGEDYTIKCICSFTDDDGTTVMCEKCDTWQHIACYYQDGNPPGDDDSHYCVDCEPRTLDSRTADEIQRRLRGSTPEETQRKPKKPGPKPKKKAKHDNLSQVQVNGHTNGHGSPRNGTDVQAKRPRARHQSSSSTTHIPLKLPGPTARRSTSASHAQPSPMKSPHSPSIACDPNEAFSPEFMHLYENDTGSSHASVNEFDDINLTMTLSDWVRDEESLAQVTNGKTKHEIFTLSTNYLQSDRPPLQIHTKVDKNITAHGTHPKWKFITVEEEIGPKHIVGELHGMIGSMQKYTQDPANRWDQLRHPVPFVFFHPQLPIIIDTREEGSVFRHLRRSCSPNMNMRTVLEEGFDYHFVFTANRDIDKGEELTIPWTLDEHSRRFFMNQKDCEADDEYIINYCRNVLAEFGGCACNETNCTMAHWAGWNEPPRSKFGKGRKRPARGFGSRSGSEALRYYDDDGDDGTAGSTSSHSKPHSRDNTPSSVIDSKNILGEPISEREKRKIAALERSEQDRQPEKKKVKRKSADNRQNSLNPPPTPINAKRPSHQDISIKRSGSPGNDGGYRDASRLTPSMLNGLTLASPNPSKPIYKETSCQTDLDATSPPRSLPSPSRPIPRRAKNPLHRHVFRRSVLKTETTGSPIASPVPEIKSESSSPAHDQATVQPDSALVEELENVDVAMDEAPLEAVAETVMEPILAEHAPDSSSAPVQTETQCQTGTAMPGPEKTDDAPHVDSGITPDEPTTEPETELPPQSTSAESGPEAMPPPSASTQRPSRPVTIASSVEQAPALVPSSTPKSEEKSPETKKKKTISLKEYSRRSSSNVPKVENGDSNAPQEGADVKSGLVPLKEEAAEMEAEAVPQETAATGNGDSMVQ